MKRRTLLAGTGTVLTTPIVGCLDSSFRSEGEHNERGDDENDREDGNDETADRSAHGDGYTYDESRRDSIFIENTTDTEVVVELLVERKSDGDVLVENVYRAPQKTGLEIPHVADVGGEYGITAKYDGTVEEYDWTVLTCAHDRGPEADGETALGVEVLEDEIRILHTGCDEAGAGEKFDLTYTNHEEYVTED